MTERRTLKRRIDDTADKTAIDADHTISIHPPTPQTLPRKRASPGDDGTAHPSPPSPSGHTTFFLSHGSAPDASLDKAAPRRRPGLMFAQQMGLTAGASTGAVKFGARLGVGVGMGGGLRGSAHGPLDKMSLENPFIDIDHPAAVGTSRSVSGKRHAIAPSPGRETSYVPQTVRPSAERSMSPLMRDRHRGGPPRMLTDELPETSRLARRRMMEGDNPFIAKPGEIVRPRPQDAERGPLVTYVFRGAKRVFANPFVPPNAPYPPADLDVNDIDYDPHPCPPPRLLWPTSDPEMSSTSSAPSTSTQRRRVLSETMDVDSDDESMPVRRGLLFGATPGEGHGELSDSSEGSARKRPRFDFGSS